MKLLLTVEGATEEELKRGAEAALAVFDDTGIDPVTAFEGMSALEGWDIKGFPAGGLSDEESKAASVWLDARQAAIEATCAEWPEDRRRNANGVLELLAPDQEERAAERGEFMRKLA